MTYIPSDKQVLAHCAEEQFIGFGGAMGGGKTRWLCEMAKILSIKFPGNLGLMGRQSGPALKLSTQEVFFTETLVPGSQEWKDLGCKFNKGEGILRFEALNPISKIWFTGMDQDNLERIKSLNLGFFGLDEATEISESTFMMLVTRLRRKGVPKKYRKGMITANPEAGWIKRRFIDQTLGNHIFVQANAGDNPYLPSDYPSLFDHMPEHWRQKYLLGNWGAVTGLIYQDFVEKRHVIKSIPIPPEWRTFRGLDHGQQNPCACLGFCYGYPSREELQEYISEDALRMVNPEFDSYPIIFAYRLYHKPGLVQDHKMGIKHVFMDIKNTGTTFADPHIWDKDRQKIMSDGKAIEFSIADEYAEPPDQLLQLVRANNQVVAGINRVATLFRIGHLYIMDHNSMKPLIGDKGEILSYAWKDPPKDDMDWPEEPMKRNDHVCDALRYGIMSLPPLKAKPTNLIPYNSFMAARQRALLHKFGARGITQDRRGRVRLIK
jgi:PBSX family phage terminase large subunit